MRFLTMGNMQAISKGFDQTSRVHRLICAFIGRTYHIVGNLMQRLNYNSRPLLPGDILGAFGKFLAWHHNSAMR